MTTDDQAVETAEKRHAESEKRWIGLIQTILLVIVIPISGWLLLRSVDQGERLTAIEASRFTPEDAKALEDRVTNPINTRLDRIEDKLDRLIEGGR